MFENELLLRKAFVSVNKKNMSKLEFEDVISLMDVVLTSNVPEMTSIILYSIQESEIVEFVNPINEL